MLPTPTQQIEALKLVIDEKRRAGATDVADALQAALTGLVQRATWAGNVTPASDLEHIPQAPITLYKQFEEEYQAFCRRETGMDGRMDGGQGRALNEIIQALRQCSATKDDAGALKSWKYLLAHWSDVGEFLQKQKTLTAINKYLVEIIETIRKANASLKAEATTPTVLTAQQQRQRQKWQGELEDVQKSIRHLESCTPYPDQATHLGQARAYRQKLEQRLAAVA